MQRRNEGSFMIGLPTKVVEETVKLFRLRISLEGREEAIEIEVRKIFVLVIRPHHVVRATRKCAEEAVHQQSANLKDITRLRATLGRLGNILNRSAQKCGKKKFEKDFTHKSRCNSNWLITSNTVLVHTQIGISRRDNS